jgi:hypothetical protein
MARNIPVLVQRVMLIIEMSNYKTKGNTQDMNLIFKGNIMEKKTKSSWPRCTPGSQYNRGMASCITAFDCR